jgi:sirohydrochlorin ferrochelatase
VIIQSRVGQSFGTGKNVQSVIIVSHGQPSDPAPAAAELSLLAAAVGALLPNHRVRGATLAQEGALESALTELGTGGRVYPLFMAGGWFTRINLPSRLAAAQAKGWQVLEPFGCDPAVHDLAIRVVDEALAARGIPKEQAQVLVAAHGSFKSSVPSDIARHVTDLMSARLGGATVSSAFIDQEPQLAQTSGFGTSAVCLPYFAAAGGHVSEDIPNALMHSGFKGHLLAALGLDLRVPAIIARALIADLPVCALHCRHAKQGT